MYNNKKRKRTNSYGKKPYKKSNTKKYGYKEKNEDYLFGKATLQKQLIIDDRQLVTLKYVDTSTMLMSIPIASALSQINTYSLNGLYDVNTALASTAIPGFIEWGTFYRHYRVRAVKITCLAVAENAGANCGIIMHAQAPDANVPLFSSWTSIREMESNPYTRNAIVGNTNMNVTQKMSMYIDLGKLNGNRLNYETDTDFAGNMQTVVSSGTNPARQPVLKIIAFKTDGALAGAAFNAAVIDLQIKFYTELYDRLDLTT